MFQNRARARRFRAVSAAVACVALTLTLSACGSDSGKPATTAEKEVSATPSAQVTAKPPADALVVAINITADSVDPNGTSLDVELNQPVVLRINAEAAGELHVHSTPEQHVEFPAGKSEITLSFDKAGLIDVEDHALDKLIVQLKVS